MRQIILFSSVVLIAFSLSCHKDNPLDSDDTPCLECPFDFGLTDFEPAWSPDGKTITYVHGDSVASKTGIWLIDDTNGTNKRILYSSIGAYSPTWSPDGHWIAFSDGGQIYKMRITGAPLQLKRDF